MTIVSKSGFIIKDVYNDLKNSMTSKDFTRVCHLSTELVCSGELKALVGWIVSLACNEFVGTNAYLLRSLSLKLSTIAEHRFKWTHKEVRMCVCEALMLLSKEEYTSTCFYKHGTKPGVFIDQLYFNAPMKYRELQDNLGLVVQHDVYSLASFLYEHMLKNDIKSVYKIMYAVLQVKQVDECETLEVVRGVKKGKNDPVWLLWQVLFVFMKRPPVNAAVQGYVSNACELFSFEYNKKLRQERLNILFVCYLICVRRKNVVYQDTYDDVVSSARDRIHIVYDELLETDTKEKHMKQQVKKQEQKKKKETKQKSTLTPEEQKALEEKLRYIFVMTYQKPRATQLETPSAVKEHMPYKFVDVHGSDGAMEECSSSSTRQYSHKVDKL
jgi:hypothetical protein